jgi:gamma-glutamyltranspeptidase
LAFREFGSGKVNWSDLVMPSVRLARDGVPVSEYLAHVLQIKEKHFRTLPSMQLDNISNNIHIRVYSILIDLGGFRSWINNRTNKVWEFGDIIYRRELADTMEKLALADDPLKLFYHGEMANTIVEEIQKNGRRYFWSLIFLSLLNLLCSFLFFRSRRNPDEGGSCRIQAEGLR